MSIEKEEVEIENIKNFEQLGSFLKKNQVESTT